MTNFNYTDHQWNYTSTAVNRTVYNENTSELLVTTTNKDSYLYSDVPVEAFKKFRDGSAGQAFNEVKKNYGPGKRVDGYIGFTKQTVNKPAPVKAASVLPQRDSAGRFVSKTKGTPKALATHKDTVDSTSMIGIGRNESIVPANQVRNDAGLASVTNINDYRLTLGENTKTEVKAPSRAQVFNYSVEFMLEGTDVIRQYNVESGSDINDALAKLAAAGDALGLTFTPVRVVVDFE